MFSAIITGNYFCQIKFYTLDTWKIFSKRDLGTYHKGAKNTPTITPNLEKRQKKQREVKNVKAITNVAATADRVESFEIFRVKGYLYDAPDTLFEFVSLQLNCSLASQLIFSGIS